MHETTIVVLEGDETGQELLEEALRVLAPDVTGIDLEFARFDLSLASRRATKNGVVHEAAAALREAGLEGFRGAEVLRDPRLRREAEGGDGRGRRPPSGGALRAAADRCDFRAPPLLQRRSARDPLAEPRRRHPLRPRAAAVRFDRGV